MRTPKDRTLNQKMEEELYRIRELNELRNQDKEETEEYYSLSREPLSIETMKEVEILLSWGGGSDGFKLYFDKENELVKGCYWQADWGTYEETWLDDDEAQEVYDFYLGGYYQG